MTATEQPDDAPIAAPATVRELLARAIIEPELGHGCEATVYRLPFSGLESFLLRVESHNGRDPHGSLKSALNSSTSITPIKKLVADIHIGQPIMTLRKDTTILPRQHGISLSDLYENLKEQHIASGDKEAAAEEKAWVEVLTRIFNLSSVKRGENPFIPVFEKLYAITQSERACDIALENLFIDEERGTFELIDQNNESWRSDLKPPEENALHEYESCAHNLCDECFWEIYAYIEDSAKWFEYKTSIEKICDLINAASEHVLAAHANDKPGEYHGLAFADVSDIKAVSLDDPPHVLVERLNQLVARGNIPLR